METSARLAKLPQEVQFPNHLKDRILYDAANGQLVFRGIMSSEEKEVLLRLSRDKTYRKATKALFHGSRKVHERLERLEKEITRYGEIFVEFPDVWNERRLIEYRSTRIEDVADMRRLYKEGVLQATLKESRTFGAGLGAGSDKVEPSTVEPPAKVAEGIALSPQEQFRHKSTFLAEVELQKLVEGRDDNTLLQGYVIYLMRFLVSVIPGKRHWFFPSLKGFDSRQVYAEVSIRIQPPEIEDLVNTKFIRASGEEEEWKARLKDIEVRRKPYIYSFIPQEYVQHIGAWSALGLKFGLDLPQSSSEAQPATPAGEKGQGKGSAPKGGDVGKVVLRRRWVAGHACLPSWCL